MPMTSPRSAEWKPEYTQVLIYTQRRIPSMEIAKRLGVSTQTISNIRSSDLFLKKLAEMQSKIIAQATDKAANVALKDKAREILNKAAVSAARTVVKLSRKGAGTDRMKFDAAVDILDRAGLKPHEVIETHDRVYPPEEIERALVTMKEIEAMTERLSETKSRFLLENPAGGSLTDERSPQQDIPSDEDSPPDEVDTDDDLDKEPLETGAAGQETLPA